MTDPLLSFPYGTRHAETEAILAAGELVELSLDTDAYAQAEDELIAWLRSSFLPGELASLQLACGSLLTCAREASRG